MAQAQHPQEWASPGSHPSSGGTVSASAVQGPQQGQPQQPPQQGQPWPTPLRLTFGVALASAVHQTSRANTGTCSNRCSLSMKSFRIAAAR